MALIEPEPAPDALTLTAEEIAEFRELRREAQERANRDREARLVEEEKRSPASHHVILAGGEIVQMSGGNLATHHSTGDGSGDPRGDHVRRIAAAHEMSPREIEQHRAATLAALAVKAERR